jgi:hypothetical protein
LVEKYFWGLDWAKGGGEMLRSRYEKIHPIHPPLFLSTKETPSTP